MSARIEPMAPPEGAAPAAGGNPCAWREGPSQGGARAARGGSFHADPRRVLPPLRRAGSGVGPVSAAPAAGAGPRVVFWRLLCLCEIGNFATLRRHLGRSRADALVLDVAARITPIVPGRPDRRGGPRDRRDRVRTRHARGWRRRDRSGAQGFSPRARYRWRDLQAADVLRNRRGAIERKRRGPPRRSRRNRRSTMPGRTAGW